MTSNYVIAGSSALSRWLPSVKPKDLDIFYVEGTEKPSIKSEPRVEYHTLPKDIIDKFETVNNYLTLQSLYVLKLSHAEYDIHWYKTMDHLMLLKQHAKPTTAMEPKFIELLDALKKHWKEVVHKDKKSKITFDVTKEKFFNQNVKRIYDHDFIHDTIRYYDKPLYTRCLKDGQEVLFDKNKFDKLTFEEKISLVREEVYVLALERFIIPVGFDADYQQAYRVALKKLVTRMSKGWFPTFIAENYDVLYRADRNYIEMFKEKIV